MFNYQLSHTNKKGRVSLQLSAKKNVLRQWSGEFAGLIWKKTITQHCVGNTTNKLLLNKKQTHHFFIIVTCLYQELILKYKIDVYLIKNNFSKECFTVAQSLLLQIRLNPCHPSHEDLMAFYFDEFNCCDKNKFNHVLNKLIGNKLIQTIHTEDGCQFFDKSTAPHDHLYLKKHSKLFDCSKEITLFLKGINCPRIQKENYSSLYTLNSYLN